MRAHIADIGEATAPHALLGLSLAGYRQAKHEWDCEDDDDDD